MNISWYDAISFCNLLSQKAGLGESYSINGENIVCDWESNGFRLPTEAEWQYACKAGTVGYRYGELNNIAWYNGNSRGKIHEIGTKEPNPWGLHDMLRNVWEWCWDIYDEQVYGTYRIFRGGSWAEDARGCGATCRRRSHPTILHRRPRIPSCTVFSTSANKPNSFKAHCFILVVHPYIFFRFF